MKKSILKIIVLTLILSFCFSSGVLASGESDELTSSGYSFEWSLFTTFGPEDASICYIWPKLFDEIKQRTNGQLNISIYWNGQHPYKGEDFLKIIKEGTVELVHLSAGYITSTEPVLGFFALPVVLPDESMERFNAEAAMWGNFEQKDGFLENILKNKWEAVTVHGIPGCWIRLFTKGYIADGIGSLKGHKIRVFSPELAKFVEILGGTPVSISYGEVYTALSTGLIDGAITTLQVANAAGWLDQCDTINLWNLIAYMDSTVVGIKALDELPDDIKKIFLDVMRTSAQKPEMLELYRESMLLEEKITEGYSLYVPDDVLKATVREKIMEQVIEPWLDSTGDSGKKAFEELEKITKN